MGEKLALVRLGIMHIQLVYTAGGGSMPELLGTGKGHNQ